MADRVIEAALALRNSVNKMDFSDPVSYVYNPLDYAWAMHEQYIRMYGVGEKKVVFLGMNPGPFGMAQTGVPFGEIAAVKDWMGLCEPVGTPSLMHPKRLIDGFECKRSEVSGRRLWGLFAERFGKANSFFKEHYVLNYCPLIFLEESGRNRTPDKLKTKECQALFEQCDLHLKAVIEGVGATWVVAVGAFAEKRALDVLANTGVNIVRILHPSPASPASNKDWGGQATRALVAAGIWS